MTPVTAPYLTARDGLEINLAKIPEVTIPSMLVLEMMLFMVVQVTTLLVAVVVMTGFGESKEMM